MAKLFTYVTKHEVLQKKKKKKKKENKYELFKII